MHIRSDVEVANLSDVGCERAQNEDYFLYNEPEDDSDFARRGRLMLIADGMGGRNGGEVASRLAAEVIRDVFLGGDRIEARCPEPRVVLIKAFHQAHLAILSLASVEQDLLGMGTTCCAAVLRAGRLYYAHIGDSRIYLVRAGQAQPLTEDHSLVARMVREGTLTPEQAATHEKRNILTAALGVSATNVAATFPIEPLELLLGDVILMCTDGLHGLVTDEEFALITSHQSMSEACRELVGLAKVRGGHDNITLQLLKVNCVER